MSAQLSRPGVADLYQFHRQWPKRFPFLLESRLHGQITGQYSLLLGDVRQELNCFEPSALHGMLEQLEPRTAATGGNTEQPPFVGGWFLYLSYEAASGLLPHLAIQSNNNGALAIARAAYCQSAVIVDHLQKKTWYVGESSDLLDGLKADARAAVWEDFTQGGHSDYLPEDGDSFCRNVEQAIEYIHAGDIYQANLSRRWLGPQTDDIATAIACYQKLRQHNKACFSVSALWEDFAIASASPERLFRVRNGIIDTRPIAGTRPTSQDTRSNGQLMEELRSHPKERAEHIMLVDLERNDLGSISKAGSVKVDELLALESYASVHHLVSNVSGRLKADANLRRILSAVFPGGTITGCPKIRCMQIIAELEGRARGAYTGSLGYVSDCGSMDFNILIRTLVWQQSRMQFDAGAGIVADSVPLAELAETQAKADGVLQALIATMDQSA
ncbi:MAG: chorismate-binding protein [Oceanococcus sp.]